MCIQVTDGMVQEGCAISGPAALMCIGHWRLDVPEGFIQAQVTVSLSLWTHRCEKDFDLENASTVPLWLLYAKLY